MYFPPIDPVRDGTEVFSHPAPPKESSRAYNPFALKTHPSTVSVLDLIMSILD